MRVFHLHFQLAVLICVTFAKKLPSFIQPCSKSMEDVGECLLKNVEILKPRLGKGIRELAIPKLNPLELPQVNLNTGGDFVAGFSNLKIYHLDDFKMEDINFNLNTLKLKISVTFPYLVILSTYNVRGKILLLQLNNTGDAYGNYTCISANVSGSGKLNDRNGKSYIHIEKPTVSLHVANAYLYFDKIFGDNEELNVHSNRLLNENMPTILEEFVPVASQAIQEVVIGIANMIFNKFSFAELFPDS